ncbi:unnamed protein product [Penicillium pancosmium]
MAARRYIRWCVGLGRGGRVGTHIHSTKANPRTIHLHSTRDKMLGKHLNPTVHRVHRKRACSDSLANRNIPRKYNTSLKRGVSLKFTISHKNRIPAIAAYAAP